MKEYLKTAVLACALTLLAMSVLSPWFSPIPVQAQEGFSSIQFSRSEGGWWFFDTRTGELWIYDESRALPLWHYKVNALGQPIERLKITGEQAEQAQQNRPAN